MLVLTRQADAGDKSIIKIIDPALQAKALDDLEDIDTEADSGNTPARFLAGVIEVEVVSIRAGAVRLRINAPRGVPVHRKEIYDAIQAELQQQAEIKAN